MSFFTKPASGLAQGQVVTLHDPDGVPAPGFVRASGLALPRSAWHAYRLTLGDFDPVGTATPSGAALGNGTTTSCAVSTDNVLHVMTGNAHIRCNLGTGEWTADNPFPVASGVPAVACATATHLFGFGVTSGSYSVNAYKMSRATGVWSAIFSPGKRYRDGFCAPLPDGRPIILGGFDLASGSATVASMIKEVKLFDEAAGVYIDKAPLPFGMVEIKGAVLSDGTLLLSPAKIELAGAVSASQSLYIYNPAGEGTLAYVGEAPAAAMQVFPLEAGKALLIRGSSMNGTAPDAYLYDPALAVGSRVVPFGGRLPRGSNFWFPTGTAAPLVEGRHAPLRVLVGSSVYVPGFFDTAAPRVAADATFIAIKE